MAATQLVPVKDAKLPVSYERAREALEKCRLVDECKDWADKAAALAAYGRQAKDPTLVKNAMHIQGRALRRAGELQAEVEPKRGANQNIRAPEDPKVLTRKSFAASGGLSPNQAKQALRIAAIPEAEFEAAFEGPTAPSMKALAKQGTKPSPKPSTEHLKGRSPEDFSASIKARGAMRDMAELCGQVSPAAAVRGANEYDLPKMRAWVETIDDWITVIRRELST